MDRTSSTPRVSSLERMRAALASQGLGDVPITTFPEGTHTATAAAAALGTDVERIVKSLVFIAGERAILVLASGPNRVDLAKVGRLVGQPITRANADQVRQATGYAIGGVPPFGHTQRLDTFLDRDLLEFDEVWAAAGRPDTVFPIDPRDLARITDARVAEVVESV
ncbi:MAG: YbaK/EbsC family protein [Chloroflexi bacterium]|nr:YbaK/EbsC family protein [Chloroflexota bacterium]